MVVVVVVVVFPYVENALMVRGLSNIVSHNEIHDTLLDITKCPLTLILNEE